MLLRHLVAPAFVLCVSACTTNLTHESLKRGAQPKEPGFTYYLPRQRFIVTATYALASCPDASGDKIAVGRPLIIKQSASIVEAPIVDPKESYSIPIGALTSGMKTTNLTATSYDNQTLHTFGATVEDRSAGIVKGALGGALSAARIMVGIPTARQPERLCRPEIYVSLDNLSKSKSKLLDPSMDEKTRATLSAAIAASSASLQITETYIFDPTVKEFADMRAPDPRKLLAWFANPQLIGTASSDDLASYKHVLETEIRLRETPNDPMPIPKELEGKGLVYRDPVPVVVQVCAGSCADSHAEILLTFESFAAQFGRYAIIPLENGPFQKNNLSLSFAQNGRLESFTYGTESSIEKIASTVSDSIGSLEKYKATKKEDDDAAAQAAAGVELKRVNADTALLKAKADKLEAEARLLNLGGEK